MERQKSPQIDRFHKGEHGQSLVDLMLILVLALVIIVFALILIGPSFEEIFGSVLGRLTPS